MFFGRDGAVEQVMGRLSACARPGGQPAQGILVVSGVSGAGKSSLLRAGVLPRLRRDGLTDVPGAESWPCLLFTPGGAPLTELAAQVAALARISADDAVRALRADPARFGLLARQAVLAQRGNHQQPGAGRRRLLIVIDQFEQLFTLCPAEEERRAFIAALHGAASAVAAEPSALVVMALRADFEARCADEYPELAAAVQDRFLLTAMTERDLELAITEPARQAGARVEQELVGCLLREVRGRQPAVIAARTSAGVLPLLSYALAETWRVHSGEVMTLQDYNETGGIEAAVATAAERAYGTLTGPQQDTARQVFLQLTTTSADGTDSSVPAARADLDAGKDPCDVQAVLDAFAAERLLTLTTEGAEISHEALLTAWPLLRDTWLAQTRTDRVIRTRLRDAASEWAAASKDRSYLWSGTLLASATAVDSRAADAPGRLLPLTRNERRFLTASHEAARRRTRRRRAGLAVFCVLVLAAAVIGAYSVREQQDAAQNTASLDSTQLAADAQALQATDPGLAAQLAVAAYRFAPTEQAATEMYDSVSMPLDTVVGTGGSEVLRVATEAEGPLAAAITQNGILQVWNLSNPSAPVLDATIRSQQEAIALSPRGGLLAGACPDLGVCLWNLANPHHPVLTGRWRMPSGTDPGITSMAISPDGELLAAASQDGYTLMWSIADPARPRLIADLPNPTSRKDGGSLAGVAFAPHVNVLAETILGGATRLWSTAGLARPALLATIKQGYASIAFDPASSMLAAVGDANAGLWQVGDPQHPKQLQVDEVEVSNEDLTAAAFSPDGEDLAFAGLDTNDALAEICTLRVPDELLDPGTDLVCTTTGSQSETASYTASGALLTGGPGGLRLWRWPEHPAEGALAGSDGPGQISPDGRLMASGISYGAQQAVDIWSLAGLDTPVFDATIPVAGFGQVQFLSPSVLLIADGNGQTRLWDLRDPHHPVPGVSLGTAGTENGATIAAESSNHLVSVEGPDGRLHLWRVTSATDAVQAGSIPGAPVPEGIDPDDQTAFEITGNKILWWDISNPAHPVRQDTSVLPGSGRLDDAITAGNLLVATTTIDPSSNPSDPNTSDLVLFDVVRGRVRSAATLSTTVGTELEVSQDHHLLAVAGADDNAVTLWDISNPASPHRLSTIPAQLDVSDIEFSPNSKVLAVSSQGAVQLWDIRNPQEPAPLGSIASLFGGDASGNSAFATEDNPVIGLAFTGQGDALAISAYLTTSLVDSDPAQLAARLCGYTGVPISPAQWQQDAPGVPYRRPCP